ncbi:hypothetical protein DCS_01303 [Drechmeria coniospora]|uniref:WD40/YVTN repeat-like-containing domain protein n=1 Tax=Drechmeria coniospora TaxID=98403 RepID=A0A151GSW4_DRECN|nr:hypothetical protein DCS_01303 [Drechmeria coniospora]KYK60168.1 hypothetical protein DCS_01303 [Drechmeria coniospora]
MLPLHEQAASSPAFALPASHDHQGTLQVSWPAPLFPTATQAQAPPATPQLGRLRHMPTVRNSTDSRPPQDRQRSEVISTRPEAEHRPSSHPSRLQTFDSFHPIQPVLADRGRLPSTERAFVLSGSLFLFAYPNHSAHRRRSANLRTARKPPASTAATDRCDCRCSVSRNTNLAPTLGLALITSPPPGQRGTRVSVERYADRRPSPPLPPSTRFRLRLRRRTRRSTLLPHQPLPPRSKKDRKHGRENGGIAAAVTKQAAVRLPNGHGGNSSSSNNSPKSLPVSDASSPPENTPEIKPSRPDNDKHGPSPLLEALSTTSVSASTAPSMANEWLKGAILAGSPGNLINLTSESPPTQPSSYEDAGRGLHHGWPVAPRPLMSPSPASLSPPRDHRRPLSIQMDAKYHVHGPSPHAVSAASHRRSSLHSPYPHSRASPHPPLPHQAQPHFYGAQDLDLTITPQSGGMKAGSHGLFLGFDKLPSVHGSAGQQNVVLAGYEGGLQVYAVTKRGLDRVAHLKGLRGGVHHAKILPWTVKGGNDGLSPLVAVVVHGPVLSPTPAGHDDEAAPAAPESPRRGIAQPEGPQGQLGRPPPAPLFYQTAVEVYSLHTSQLVDVLLQTQKLPINTEVSIYSPLFKPPPPSGALTVKADAGTVAVCSGITGECWVYRQLVEAQNEHAFACTGKLWTTLQQGHGAEVPEEAAGGKAHPAAASQRPSPQTPILALGGHWIAYCPAAPSSQISLRAHVPVPILGRAPGVSSLTPPHLPAVSAAVELPISDSVVNKIMRETTQELIQGARWVGQQGLQAWNSYWNKPSGAQSQQQQQQQQQQQPARTPPQPWVASQSPRMDAAQFPPTHGPSSNAAVKEPGLVSLLDAQTLANSTSAHPLATFATPLGCSFISFSPSSLALFTASTKGDVQTVWDLLRVQHTHSSPLQSTLPQHDSGGPLVRQIAQFSRMTVARIVDVAWSSPQGDRLAMVTERGTVHLLDMPFSAFMWPPPRRRKVATKSVAETPDSAVSIASGAFGAAYQVAKPFVTRSRRSSAHIPATSGSTLRDSAAQGGRAIAASISHSLGKTGTAISQLRHTGENRVSLPPSAVLPSASCVIWLRSRKSQVLGSLGGGLVRMFPCTPMAGKRTARVNRYKDVKLPLLPDDVVAPVVRQIMEMGAADENLELSDAEMEATNTTTVQARVRPAPPAHGMDAAIPQAEIESSAPYQPFHTDRRVVLSEYVRDGPAAHLSPDSAINAHAGLDEQPSLKKKKKRQQLEADTEPATAAASAWAFGQDIPSIKRDRGLGALGADEAGPEDHLALPQSAMERVMQVGDEEQIVVTTRRRRRARPGDPDEDGFFEDDCEVLDFADQRV